MLLSYSGGVVLALSILSAYAAHSAQMDPASQQIIRFWQNTTEPVGIMTTSNGAPVELEYTSTLNEPLIYNNHFMETMTHLVREKNPDRIVHVKGAGAFGYFEVTHNLTDICGAKLFSENGKKTPLVVRFSSTALEKGSPDTRTDARGFAIKFYTEEGNFDIVGLNTPMYLYKDPILFPTYSHALKRNPVTNLIDPNTMWDILTLRPESLHIVMYLFGGNATPDGFEHMPGFALHTYVVVNARGEKKYVRFHFMPTAGIKNLSFKESRRIASEDPDYANRGLFNLIETGDYPCWLVSVQVLSEKDVKTAGFDVFDVTKILPLSKYPLRPVGKLTLNKNPTNYFADVEQLAFSPANLVPGIMGAPDKVFEGRCLAYRDAQYYRLGANFNNIAVNCPFRNRKLLYSRDGSPSVGENGKGMPNYYPNSYNGPVPYEDKKKTRLSPIKQDDSNNFDQAADLYMNQMTKEERTRLINTLVLSLKGTLQCLQVRAVKLFMSIEPDLGNRVAVGLGINSSSAENCCTK